MNDAIDGGMDNADDMEASEKVYQQICDEIGVDLGSEAISAGNSNLIVPAQNQPVKL
jgi:hypothetical protein